MLKSRRLERNYKQTLHGKKEEIFKLLCPVREKEWLQGWDYTMIYSESGLAEKGCVFETDNDFGSYQWIMTKYDDGDYGIQFVKFIQSKLIVVIDIQLTDGKGDIVYCEIKYTFTAINDDIIEQMHEENTIDVFNGHMKLWEDSINHFLKTGEMLQ
ncbi:hypothetical protein R9X47_06260 [Wukongibacter baidiensis]|uniref:hypothetical protein n=1 Tax=Wukongibacter baidiensis TaxID=1723361 RepID=UPI003D7F52F6